MRLARILVFLPLVFSAPSVSASVVDLDFHDCASTKGPGEGECQHFLRNPAGVTDDPCWCDKCRNGATFEKHDGKTVPFGWNQTLFESHDLDVYLKRHAVAWGITCSECLANEKAPWPDGGGAAGPLGTPPAKDFGGRPAKATVDAHLATERKLFKKPEDVVLAYDRRFYIATDVEPLKVHLPGGASRVMSRHEWAHLMIERAEFARREWVRNFGEVMSHKPIALFFPQRESDLLRIGQTYFHVAGANGIRGGAGDLCDDFCLTAIAFSHEKDGDDQALQIDLRHKLSRNLLSIYAAMPTRPKSLPVWLDEGLAHWLVKTRFPEAAHYDAPEGSNSGGGKAPQWPGKDWDKDVVKYVQSGKVSVLEEFLGKLDVGQLTEDDHKRAWSICDLCLAEWREPFVKLVRALRNEKDLRESFTKSFGVTPEEFDDRWKERVLGKRKSMSTKEGEEESADAAGERDRKSIRAETAPQTLAAKIRGLGEIKDAKTVPVVLDVIAQNSDLVRETAFCALLRVRDKACVEALWSHGIGSPEAMVRAYAARLCGRLKIAAAVPKLEAQLDDKNWLARAEAAYALGILKDANAMAAMRKMVSSDPAEKAQVGAIDALALFGEDAGNSVPVVAKALDHAQWQVRVAAAQALGKIGSMDGVEPLVARMEKETGRVADEIHEALKSIARDDLGRRAASWRKWWETEKANSPNGPPKRPDDDSKKKGPDFDDPHATHDEPPPKTFGVEIYSSRIAFVVDTTETMLTLFTPDPSAMKLLSREYVGRDKLAICKEEIEQALAHLDPRALFNVVAFGMQIKSFRPNPVPATKGDVEDAKKFLDSLAGAGRTNYYGALKAALDVGADTDANPNFHATPDTITFLTDGLPNEGDIIEAETLVEWYAGLDRYARVKTNTVAFGVVGVDTMLLKGLAERNGGHFLLVAERKQDDK